MKKIWKIKDKIVFANTLSTAIATFLIIFSMFLYLLHFTLEIEIEEIDHIFKNVVEHMEDTDIYNLRKFYENYEYADKEYMSVAAEEKGKIIYLDDDFDSKELNNFITGKTLFRKDGLIYNSIYEDRNGRKYYLIRHFKFKEFDEISYVMLVLLILIIITEYIISRIVTKNILDPISHIIKQSKEIDRRNIDVQLTKTRDDEIGDLIDVLNHTFLKKEELIKSQKKFSSNVSHELKTPLAIMKGYLDILKWGKDDEKLLNESIENLDMEVKNIENIINSLFLSSNLEKIQIKKENIDVKNLLEKIRKDYEVLQDRLKIKMIVKKDIELIGDSYLLSEAVRGIIDNGIKYSDGELIELILEEGETKKIVIRNYGPSIEPADLERIFERYYKKDSKKSGVGLGLSIIREIIELNGGKIKAENRKDGVDMILSF